MPSPKGPKMKKKKSKKGGKSAKAGKGAEKIETMMALARAMSSQSVPVLAHNVESAEGSASSEHSGRDMPDLVMDYRALKRQVDTMEQDHSMVVDELKARIHRGESANQGLQAELAQKDNKAESLERKAKQWKKEALATRGARDRLQQQLDRRLPKIEEAEFVLSKVNQLELDKEALEHQVAELEAKVQERDTLLAVVTRATRSSGDTNASSTDRGLLYLVLEALRQFPNDKRLYAEACSILPHLLPGRSELRKFAGLGGLRCMLDAMTTFFDDDVFLADALSTLHRIAGRCDEVLDKSIKYGVVNLLFKVIATRRFSQAKRLHLASCRCLQLLLGLRHGAMSQHLHHTKTPPAEHSAKICLWILELVATAQEEDDLAMATTPGRGQGRRQPEAQRWFFIGPGVQWIPATLAQGSTQASPHVSEAVHDAKATFFPPISGHREESQPSARRHPCPPAAEEMADQHLTLHGKDMAEACTQALAWLFEDQISHSESLRLTLASDSVQKILALTATMWEGAVQFECLTWLRRGLHDKMSLRIPQILALTNLGFLDFVAQIASSPIQGGASVDIDAPGTTATRGILSSVDQDPSIDETSIASMTRKLQEESRALLSALHVPRAHGGGASA